MAPPVPPKPPDDTPVVPPSGNGLMPNLGGPGLGGRTSTEFDLDMKFESAILSFYWQVRKFNEFTFRGELSPFAIAPGAHGFNGAKKPPDLPEVWMLNIW